MQHLCSVFIAIFTAVSCSQPCAASDELRSLTEIEDFLHTRTNVSHSVRLKAIIQAIKTTHTPGERLYIVQDTSGQRQQFLSQALSTSESQLTIGDEILITGRFFNCVRNDPAWHSLHVVKTGNGNVVPPLDLAIREIDNRRHNLYEIATTGAVSEVCTDEADSHYQLLTLQDGESFLRLSIQSHLITNALALIGAQIKVQGVYERAISGVRKYNGPVLSVEKLTVLKTPDTTPFDAPPLDTHFYQSPEELSQTRRRTIRGEVLACWGRHSILLNATDGSLVCIETTDIAPLPPVGAIITASGFPDTDRYHLFLSRAICRTDRLGSLTDEKPNATSISQLSCFTDNPQVFCADYHGRLIVLEGILRSAPPPDTPDRHAYIECDGIPLRVDFSSVPNAFQNIEIGSVVSITGRGIAQIENKTIFNRFPKQSSFMLVLRSPQDIRVLKRPPWWTPMRLLSVIGLLLVSIAGLLARILLQRRTARLKLAERTRLAVELHDSLSQTLAGLACQISATGDALADDPALACSRLNTAKRMLQSCRSELRQCLYDLRSNALNEKEFSSALSRTVEPLKQLANVAIRFNVRRSLLDDSIAHATLAIVRELVANAIQHGAAENIRIAGTVDHGQLMFSVSDDGEGFDPSACAGITEGHFGLNGIRERIKSLKGAFNIRSTPGKGTHASATIPLNPQ